MAYTPPLLRLRAACPDKGIRRLRIEVHALFRLQRKPKNRKWEPIAHTGPGSWIAAQTAQRIRWDWRRGGESNPRVKVLQTFLFTRKFFKINRLVFQMLAWAIFSRPARNGGNYC